MGSPLRSDSLSTFLWLGDGGRPTYGVVEHFLRWRWPTLSSEAEQNQQRRQWRLYTLDHQLTMWPLTDYWPHTRHLQGDFLMWDATPYKPYEVVFVDNILCSGHATQSANPTLDTWESLTLQGQTRQYKLVSWAVRLAMLEATYVLTSGTVDPDDPEDGDVIPDLTDFHYTLGAYRRYDPKLYTGWYIWHRRSARWLVRAHGTR
jgi:hypothetical protein